MNLPTRPAGVLVIRLWAEGETEADLRARLVVTPNVAADSGQEFAVGGREAVLAAVTAWVDSYLGYPRVIVASDADTDNAAHDTAVTDNSETVDF